MMKFNLWQINKDKFECQVLRYLFGSLALSLFLCPPDSAAEFDCNRCSHPYLRTCSVRQCVLCLIHYLYFFSLSSKEGGGSVPE